MRGRIFWLALFLIGLSWILNSFYAHSKQLDAPIFLDHYIAQPVYEDNNYLTLYYLTNINDDSRLSHVNFGGITGYVTQDDFFDDFGFYENEFNPDLQTFTHYALREIRIELNSFEFEDVLKENDELIVHEMELFFSDGRDITVPIGEVILQHPYQNETGLSQPWGSSSNDNSSIFSFSAEESLTIDSIIFNFDEAIKDLIFVKIDPLNTITLNNHIEYDLSINNWSEVPGIEIKDFKFPYELKKGEIFNLYTQISPNFFGSLESPILITGSTESGKPFTSYSLINNQQPYLEQKDVDRIIQARGVSK